MLRQGRRRHALYANELYATAASSSSSSPAAGIEPGADAERQGPLVVDMPDREAERDRHAERLEVGREDLVEAEGTVAHVALQLGESPDGHPGQAGQYARRPQVREHAVHPVEIFPHVLEEEDRAIETGPMRRPHQALQQAQVAAHERPFGHPGPDGQNPVVLGHQHAGGLGEPAEAAGRLGAGEDPLEVESAECRHGRPGGRTVKGDQSGVARGGEQEGGDIAVAYDDLGPVPQGLEGDPVEDAGDAVPTTNAPNGIDGGIRNRLIEIGQPVVVGAGEIAVPSPGVSRQDRDVIQRTAERLGPV